MNLISVVLGTPSMAARDASTLAVLRYGFANFVRRSPVRAGEVVARLRLRDRTGAFAAAVTQRGFSRVLARDVRVRTRVVLRSELAAPLAYHARVGTLIVLAGGRVLDRIPLLLAHAVPAPKATRLAGLVGPITLVCALILVSVAVVTTGFGRRRTRGIAQGRRRT
jgi:D-alanyl-D-alanine carboxypeptidase (penicillin-binding protein 5/6)